jgi:hypothetical protein
MEVTIAPDGTYSGRVLTISIQRNTVLPMGNIIVDGTTARWRQPSVRGSYEGRFTDGMTLDGTWWQAGSSPSGAAKTVTRLPLVFHKLHFP